MTGKFITIEGISGSGKSIQLRKLAAHLQRRGVPFVSTCDRDVVVAGRDIHDLWLADGFRGIDLEKEIRTCAAEQAGEVREVIVPMLKAGYTVITERHFTLLAAYALSAGGMDPQAFGRLRKAADAGLRPDLSIILDVDTETALACASNRRLRRVIHSSPLEREFLLDYLDGVRSAFLRFATQTHAPVSFISTAQSVEATHREIAAQVDALLSLRTRRTLEASATGPEDFERLVQTAIAVRQEWGEPFNPSRHNGAQR